MISEIDYATKAIEETSARRKELEEAIAQLTTEIEERRNARPEEETAQTEVVTAWEKQKEKLLKRVHKLSKEAKKVEEEIQPKNRARFLRLLESKQGTSVSRVVDGSCSLCHFALRPHLQQRVRQMRRDHRLRALPPHPLYRGDADGRQRSSRAMISELSDRLAAVRHRVDAAASDCGRDPAAITLISVGKTFPAEVVNEAVTAGATDLGENRVQEAVAKKPEVAEARWHLIGPLQRNKATCRPRSL